MIMELFLGLKYFITRGWNRSYMFCKYEHFEIFFDLHCNHWPFASVSCNVLIMDVVWSFCYIYRYQATVRRENEKIRVESDERERGRHFASLKWLQKSLQNYLQNQCVCHNFSITGRLNLKCMCSCQYLYIRYIILTFTEFFEYQKEIYYLLLYARLVILQKILYPYYIH